MAILTMCTLLFFFCSTCVKYISSNQCYVSWYAYQHMMISVPANLSKVQSSTSASALCVLTLRLGLSISILVNTCIKNTGFSSSWSVTFQSMVIISSIFVWKGSKVSRMLVSVYVQWLKLVYAIWNNVCVSLY